MTSAHLDPMQDNTKRLAQALTTARSAAQSADGFLVIEACADGQITVRIDDRALRYGGPAVAAELTRLAAQALMKARAEVREAAAAFAADPRIAATVAATEDAMSRPMTAGAGPAPAPHAGQPADRYHQGTQEESRSNDWQPPARSPQAAPGQVPYDLYDDDDDDPHYRPKSWLV
ncbi:hypothetical protein AB0L57_13310 [Nocardia sp. NPDC052254]|uniref:hypothetical protein n=1 Tax=Nocardia sp. NPDC052254 TaxID=3155681 RepID=UPI00342F4E2E